MSRERWTPEAALAYIKARPGDEEADRIIRDLCAELAAVREALRKIRALDHDAFDTAFRYEQAVRVIANAALVAGDETRPKGTSREDMRRDTMRPGDETR